MEPNFIVVPQEFFEENEGHENGVNKLFIRQTSEGSYVTSINALDEFPELFQEMDPQPQQVYLTFDDFPAEVGPAALSA